jgi:cellulose biosynthesis protein BcsQ
MKKMAKRKRISDGFVPSVETIGSIQSIREKGGVSICFFNHKGGVGKTTLVANLAAELTLEHNCKVLLIDADPQCNLSQYVLDEDSFLDLYSGNNDDLKSIYEIIHPLSIGRGYTEALPILTSKEFGCDIIAGDPRLALKEDLLATDWRDAKSGGTRGLRTTFVFRDLIRKATEYDFILFDMGPSLGAINRSVMLAVDFFVVPISIDIFSLWALRNIGSAVGLWEKELSVGLNMAEDPIEFLEDKNLQGIRLLGYVTQQHKERNQSGTRRIVEAYDEINRRLPEEVANYLQRFYNPIQIEPHLGDIKNLSSLAPKSQTLHTPMITVRLSGSYTSLRKHAREMYRGIAARLLNNIDRSVQTADRL